MAELLVQGIRAIVREELLNMFAELRGENTEGEGETPQTDHTGGAEEEPSCDPFAYAPEVTCEQQNQSGEETCKTSAAGCRTSVPREVPLEPLEKPATDKDTSGESKYSKIRRALREAINKEEATEKVIKEALEE